jgi:hypothetical protein
MAASPISKSESQMRTQPVQRQSRQKRTAPPCQRQGDTLTLIRNDHTERTYGPEPKIGDEVEAKIWYDKEDAVIDGEHRAAYDICSIETYSWLIESGQRSRYPEVR